MATSKTTSITIGGNFLNSLTIVFIVMKLTHHIEWSWWWVLAPLWIPVSIALFLVFLWAVVKAYSDI